MFSVEIAGSVAPVSVSTTSNRGYTPEEVAEMCLSKIIQVSNTAPPEIQQQARAYCDALRNVLVYYMKQAVASDRTTLFNLLKSQGHEDLAEIVRRM
jgi:hypothetical protein|tara:strand:+ start:606 stop:896 length:291 start_codon:yes stop_codon:yes gene_type:complete